MSESQLGKRDTVRRSEAGASVVVRVARPEEYPQIAELSVEAYRDSGQFSEHYAPFLADVRGRAEHGTVLTAVDEHTGAVLGSTTFVLPGTPLAEVSAEGEAEFRTLAVAPEAQGRGAGEALVRACLERAAGLGCRAVVICTRDIAIPAQRLYQRLGFRRTPERDWAPVPGITLLALRRELPVDARL
ncbi:GNAT family N-acetyltransferase [Rugosimonospora acidiphila]|uniref:GNAT family N-acetyltransferase n=1 Tax=Rugosimonospora acidiphila TaxID=556531 RepID=A0ABP9RR60_9ACTN